jgi:pSer/pThr/pTyr-binding forkhead associated (FHA) protein/class 3 adenylate cyclase
MQGNQFEELHQALISAFDQSSLTIMVRVHLGQKLARIVAGGTFNDAVFQLVEWAERQGQVAELVRAAYRANPRNEALAQFIARYGQQFGVAGQAASASSNASAAAIHAVKTILEVDMVGYSSIARMLEQNVSASAVAELNAQVQSFVDAGLRAAALPREGTVMATTGDGAILVFDRADQAHRFAAATHAAAKAHSAQRNGSAKRRFRMGAATGTISLLKERPGGYEMAGITIANAVRLEAASRPGTLLIDVATYEALPTELQVVYQAEEVVRGKRDETFRARRCVMDPDADDGRRVLTPETGISKATSAMAEELQANLCQAEGLARPDGAPASARPVDVPLVTTVRDPVRATRPVLHVRVAFNGASTDVLFDQCVLHIGRFSSKNPPADIGVHDPTVSRWHAQIRWEGRNYWVADTNSLGGTFVNGQRLLKGDWVPLSTGTRIDFGDSTATFRIERRSEGENVDVILCHSGGDRAQVLQVARELRNSGINPWWNEHGLTASTTGIAELKRVLRIAGAAAVIWGPNSPGQCQINEIEVIERAAADERVRIIPVILGGVRLDPDWPELFGHPERVDFRLGNQDPVKKLVAAISKGLI